MDATRLGPLAAIDWLTTYFVETLKCRFFIGDVPVRSHEVFDEEGALYAFAILADKRGKYLFDVNVVKSVEYSPSSLLGYRVVLEPEINSIQLLLLSQTAEEVFGIDPGVGNKEVDLEPIIEYLMLEPEERTEENCPWKPLTLLS